MHQYTRTSIHTYTSTHKISISLPVIVKGPTKLDQHYKLSLNNMICSNIPETYNHLLEPRRYRKTNEIRIFTVDKRIFFWTFSLISNQKNFRILSSVSDIFIFGYKVLLLLLQREGRNFVFFINVFVVFTTIKFSRKNPISRAWLDKAKF